jgi:putative transposase
MLELTKQMYADYDRFPSINALNELAKTSSLYSQTSQDIFIRLKKSISGMIARKKKGLKAGFPRFKGADRMKSLTYPQYGFFLNGKKLKVTPFGEINIRLHREIEGTIKTLTLKKESTKWYAIFTVETEANSVSLKEGKKIGIDLGLMTFATLSDGKKIKKPKHLQAYEDKLAFRQKELSNKKLRSKNRIKAKFRLANMHSRLANIRIDWLHKTANSLLKKYSLITFEDLDVQGIAEKHGKGVSDAGWRIFTDIISYKAEGAGCEVVFVDPKNTTKDCSSCGFLVKKELYERKHNCPSCGLNIDRDLNAAINILKKATGGTPGSNACEDVSIETSMKQEANHFNG